MYASRLRSRAVATALAAYSVLWLSGCAETPVSEGVAAPRLVVGDHWQYRVTDNLRRGAVSQLDTEVIAVSAHAVRIRIDLTDDYGRSERVDEVDGEGGLRSGSLWREPSRPFDPPARLIAFPLDQGKTWRQVIDTLRKDTELKDQILIYGRVQGPDPTTVPAGSFNAVYIYRIVQLDDAEPWRSRTVRRDAVWYASEAKGPVREVREASYNDKSGRDPPVRTESTLLELVSFQPGAK